MVVYGAGATAMWELAVTVSTAEAAFAATGAALDAVLGRALLHGTPPPLHPATGRHALRLIDFASGAISFRMMQGLARFAAAEIRQTPLR